MKRLFKNFAFIIIASVLANMFVFFASAENAVISFNSNSPKINDSFVVTVKVSSNVEIDAIQFSLKYNSNILRFEEADKTTGGGAGILNIVDAPSGKTFTCVIKFTAISAGKSDIQVYDGRLVKSGENEKRDFTGATSFVTVSDASKSSNANLKALSLSNGTLSPAFSASRTNYTATVPNSVTESRVYATAEDSTATVSVGGSNSLNVGKNNRTVTVTAASGAKKTYTIVITRQAASSGSSSDNSSSGSSSSNTSSSNSSGNTSSGSSSGDNSSDNTSSALTSSDAPVANPENPYEAVLNGVTLTIATDLSSVAIPNGFTSTTVDRNGAAVSVAEDAGKNYTVYYLKAASDTEYTPYILDDDGKSFKKLKYAVFGANTYIIEELPDSSRIADGYYETNVDIGEFNVKAYASEAPEMKDLYYIYCFFNDGFGMYRYDSREQVLQRSPEFKLYGPQGAEVVAGLAERFSSLSLNGKVILVGLCIAVLGALALIVLLIIKVVASRKTEDFDDEEDMFGESFDSIETNDDSLEK